jgi:hypothetical protein
MVSEVESRNRQKSRVFGHRRVLIIIDVHIIYVNIRGMMSHRLSKISFSNGSNSGFSPSSFNFSICTVAELTFETIADVAMEDAPC